MMEIVEAGQGNVVIEPKTGELVDQHLGGCTGVKLITLERGRLKENGRQHIGTDFRRGNVLQTGARLIVYRVEFDQKSLLARLPFFQLAENHASQPSSHHVEAIHADAPADRCFLLRFAGRSAVDIGVGAMHGHATRNFLSHAGRTLE